MRRSVTTAAIATCLAALAPGVAAAQERGDLFLAAGGGITIESGPSDSPYLSPGLSGTAPALTIGAGVHLQPRLTAGFEASLARGFTGQQVGRIAGGNAEYQRTHRDHIYAGVLRYRAIGAMWVGGGVGVARSRTEEVSFRRFFTATPRVEGPFTREQRKASAVLIGAVDYSAAALGRAAIVPSLRVHLFDHDEGDASTRLGLGPLVVRPALTIVIPF